jgi:spermidine/putrescine-binding protein
VLNIYNWSDYIDDRTIRCSGPGQHPGQLRRLLLQRGPPGPDEGRPTSYDIIVPTNQFVPTYLKLGLIEPLRQGPDPQPDQPRPGVRRADYYDAGNRLHRPLAVGTTGIGFNRAKVPGGKLESWSAVFEPDPAAGRVTLLRGSPT